MVRLDHIVSEPHRTYTNHIITEIARCVEVYHRSSGWFDCTEPFLCTSLQGKQGVQGALYSSGWFKHIEPHRTYSNHNITAIARWFPLLYRIEGMQGAICTSLTRFKHIEPHRTFSTCVLTEIARYKDFFHTSSGWFDWTKSSLTPALRGIQGVQGALCTSSIRFKHVQARYGEVCHMRSMCLNHPELLHKHPAHLVVSTANLIEPTRTTSSQK